MKVLILLTMISVLTGCQLFTKEPEVKYITKTEYVTIDLNKTLRQSCKTSAPIEVEKYMEFNLEEREAYLTDYSISLIGDVAICNQLRAKVIEVIDSTNELYKEKKDERQPKN